MGQIIAFPFHPPYPDRAADLDRSECILLVAIRTWVQRYRDREDAIPHLCQGLETTGAHDSAFSIDGLMTTVSRTVTRTADIHCPRCPHLSDDEKTLLCAVSLAQADENHLAAKVLRTTLLSAQGAQLAIGSLEGLGELFTQARLLLTRRRLPNADHPSSDSREAWLPPRSVH
jgi:hypothetical protein